MWITPDRLVYVGLLGRPTVRTVGALQLYVASEGELKIQIAGGEWQTTEMAVVYPYVSHQIEAEARLIYSISIEPESIDLDAKPIHPLVSGAADSKCLLQRVRSTVQWMRSEGEALNLSSIELDDRLFGTPLKPRVLDSRIQQVIELLSSSSDQSLSAEDCAQHVSLSFSRLLHLFKGEVGYPFRSFRSWKKARHLLEYVTSSSSLTNVALDIGYPDSAYFSNSIKQTYGLKPKEMFIGSRQLAILKPHPAK